MTTETTTTTKIMSLSERRERRGREEEEGGKEEKKQVSSLHDRLESDRLEIDYEKRQSPSFLVDQRAKSL